MEKNGSLVNAKGLSILWATINNKQQTILIVEDTVDLAEGLAEFLEADGFQTDFAYRGDTALSLMETNNYDLILLDINLPGLNGIEVCKSLTQNQLAPVPVLMITAQTELDDKLSGFEAGAWDYLTKPFSFKELRARVYSLLARNNLNLQQEIQAGGLKLNLKTDEIFCHTRPVKLQRNLHLLLRKLIEQAPAIVSNNDLSRLLWGEQIPQSEPLRAQIYKLRQAIKDLDTGCQIKTTKGRGYSIEATN